LKITIEIAGAVRGKAAPRAQATKFGPRIYQDEATRHWEAELRFAGERAMEGRPPTIQPVRVDIEARFPIPQGFSKKARSRALLGEITPTVKPDVDNISKSFGDGLNQVVWSDDKQITELRVRKIYSDKPGITATIEEIGPAPAAWPVQKAAARPAARQPQFLLPGFLQAS
jgi:Holliday junction resolvase RusA-like endonuclease